MPEADHRTSFFSNNIALLLAIVLVVGCVSNLPSTALAQTNSDEASLTIKLNKSYNYYKGEPVSIVGQVNDPDETEIRHYEGLRINLTLFDPSGEVIKSESVRIWSNGSFFYSFEHEDTYGQHLIVATYSANSHKLKAEAKFYVMNQFLKEPKTPEQKQSIELIIEGKSYEVVYKAPSSLSLSAIAGAGVVGIMFGSSDYWAILELPRALIDSKNDDGHDGVFTVYSDDGHIMDVTELETNAYTRTILLNYTALSEARTFFVVGTEMAGKRVQIPSITAEIDRVTFRPGEHVNLSGAISVHKSEFPVSLEVINEKQEVLFSKTIAPNYFGDFSYTVALTDNLENEGDYSIIVRYLYRVLMVEYSVKSEDGNDRILPVVFVSEISVRSISTAGNILEPFGPADVAVNVTNDSPFHHDLPIVALFEIRDSLGVTVFIASQSDILAPNTEKELSVDWPVSDLGRYQVRAFVISNFTNPEVLSGTTSSEISVEMPVGSKFGIGPVITQSESPGIGVRRAYEY